MSRGELSEYDRGFADGLITQLREHSGKIEELKRQLKIVEASNDRMAKTLEYGGKDWPPVEEP